MSDVLSQYRYYIVTCGVAKKRRLNFDQILTFKSVGLKYTQQGQIVIATKARVKLAGAYVLLI